MNINIHTSHPSAFISSTFLDLKPERAAVASVLKEANLIINALDIKPASNNSSKKEIITGIKESDFFILIVGDRYGSIIPKMTFNSTLSITWWEYNQAKRMNKSIVVFFKENISTEPVNYDDKTLCDYEFKRKKLVEFKNILTSQHKPNYFSTHEELTNEVEKSLIPIYRDGVKILLEKQKILENEIEYLKGNVTPKRLESSISPNITSVIPYRPSAIDSPLVGAGGLLATCSTLPENEIGLRARNGLLTAIPARYARNQQNGK